MDEADRQLLEKTFKALQDTQLQVVQLQESRKKFPIETIVGYCSLLGMYFFTILFVLQPLEERQREILETIKEITKKDAEQDILIAKYGLRIDGLSSATEPK